ncbi:MAG: ribokinase, partial [Alphaproteobacteria bacterium]|nr:ribokinase [Alphaproteobacteria bacterium]
KEAGVTPHAFRDPKSYTGAAMIFVDDASGDNAIIISSGAAAFITLADIWSWAEIIDTASVFVTQLEQPLEAAHAALSRARAAGVTTILNTAPAREIADSMIALCDYMTPNETEAGGLTGLTVDSLDGARAAGDALLRRGAGTALITLGERGALLHMRGLSEHVPAFDAGPVVDTTGAGDAFNGGLAVALAEGRKPLDAVRFAAATAAISVTRPGAAKAMPQRGEIEALLNG